MDKSETLTDLERENEYCTLRFEDGHSFKLDYVELRLGCPCAKCGPRQENQQRLIEFREEVLRLRLEKPKAELVGRYGLRFGWPSGCSSGIYSFGLLRQISEENGSIIN
jgi:DUF971 family protein